MKAVTFDSSLSKYIYTFLAGKVSKKLYCGGLSCVKMENINEPELPGEDWVKVKTIYGGICGSDTNLVFLHDTPTLSPFVSEKFVIGHENVGNIVEKGKNVKDFNIGDRIVADILLPCETFGSKKCKNCSEGNTNLCENFSKGKPLTGMMLGTCNQTGGSWGEYYVAHKSQLFKVPDNLSSEQAVLVDPLASAIHPALKSLPEDSDKILIIGMGIIGLMMVAFLRYAGCKANITVIARYDFQGQLAKKYGADQVIYSNNDNIEQKMADLTGACIHKPMIGEKYLMGGYDKIFDCVGSQRSIKDCLRFVKSGGNVVLTGLAANINIDWTLVWFKEINLQGIYCYGSDNFKGANVRTYKIALDMLSSGKIDTAPLVTHVFTLSDYKKAIDTASSKGRHKSIKVLLKSI
ncbi:UNVERIFIED_CONTAM: threonine dehydrogenase-like Zn-dependent dehydrogenase [Acetivibrio alkalicellulosi]